MLFLMSSRNNLQNITGIFATKILSLVPLSSERVEKTQGLELEDLSVNPNSFAHYPGEVDKLL